MDEFLHATDPPPPRRKLSRLIVTAAGTGVACAVAIGGFVLADRGSNPSARPAPTSATAADVQPWQPLPPGPEPSPSPSVSPSPSSMRACTAADLSLSHRDLGAAAGTGAGLVLFRNTSASACQLQGAPIITDNLKPTTQLIEGSDVGDTEPALLQPGQTGGFTAFVPDAGCPGDAPGTTTELRVEFEGGGSVALPATLGLHCLRGVSDYGLAHHDPSDTNRPWDLVPVPTATPTPASGIDSLTATMALPATASAGTDVDYTITLTNPGPQPVSLTPCPTYSEKLKSDYAKTPLRYTLNCAAVPNIPAGGSARFAMRFYVPADKPAGQDDLNWWIGGTTSVNVLANSLFTITTADSPAS